MEKDQVAREEYLVRLATSEETLFHSPVLDEAVEWAREWLLRPFGIAVVIQPPSGDNVLTPAA